MTDAGAAPQSAPQSVPHSAPQSGATAPVTANPRQIGPIRDVEGSAHFEFFLVVAVVTIAVTRIYLEMSGYPQIGGSGGLHVAHVLFGGLLMLAALLVFMLFLGRRSRWVGVLLGGVGFGLFIDEVGKFVTQDNNYFFKPTAAIIYVLFVVVYLLVDVLVARRRFSDRELLVGALKVLQEAAADDLDEGEEKEARRLLEQVSPDAPMRAPVVAAFDKLEGRPSRLRGLAPVYRWIRASVAALTRSHRAQVVGVVLFAAFNVLALVGPARRFSQAPPGSDVAVQDLVYVGSAVLTAVVAVVALVLWRRGHVVVGLRLFTVSLTFQLLVVQFFQLLDTTFWGFGWVLVNLLLLAVCRSMLFRVEHPERAAVEARIVREGAGSGT